MEHLTVTTPKPMVTVQGQPILWHVMQHYAAFGHTDFYLAVGYRSNVIKSFVLALPSMVGDFRVEFGEGPPTVVDLRSPPAQLKGWRVACVETGADTLTGTRLRRIADLVPEDRFMVTYADGLGEIDINSLIEFHLGHGRLATITAVQPPGRFGELVMQPDTDRVAEYREKPPRTGQGLINGGYMVFEREAIERYIPADRNVALESEPFSAMSMDGELMAYVHEGFWQHMDTPRDRDNLERVWRPAG